MAALSQNRMKSRRTVDRDMVPIAANVRAFEGAMACLDTSTGYYRPGVTSTTLIAVGTFYEECDNTGGSAGAKSAHVLFSRQPFREGWENDATNPVTAADLGKLVYIVDDHTVSILSTGRSVAGRAMSFSPEGLVEVEMSSNVAP